jgi:DNA polymerase
MLVKNFLEWERDTVYPEFVLAPDRSKTTADSRQKDLQKLAQEVNKCHKCFLGTTRIKAVFGCGSPRAKIMFVGEGPGYQEDHRGEPFVGRAGLLLDELLREIGLRRKDVYITNVVKCHPMIDPEHPEKRGNDRPPRPEEIRECLAYLRQQIEIIRPRVICALGSVAGQTLSGLNVSLGQMRRQTYDFSGITLLVTYHPAAILRNDNYRPALREDLKKLQKLAAG